MSRSLRGAWLTTVALVVLSGTAGATGSCGAQPPTAKGGAHDQVDAAGDQYIIWTVNDRVAGTTRRSSAKEGIWVAQLHDVPNALTQARLSVTQTSTGFHTCKIYYHAPNGRYFLVDFQQDVKPGTLTCTATLESVMKAQDGKYPGTTKPPAGECDCPETKTLIGTVEWAGRTGR